MDFGSAHLKISNLSYSKMARCSSNIGVKVTEELVHANYKFIGKTEVQCKSNEDGCLPGCSTI
jgi:hypothetical protein